MNKRKLFDNSNLQNDIQWGNIQLPGLSDEELLKTNWNYVDANKQKAQNPAFQEKRMTAWREAIKSDEWKQGAKERGKKRKENLKLKKEQSQRITNLNKDEDLKKIRHDSIRKTWSKEDKKIEHSRLMKEIYKDNPTLAQQRANKRKIPLISNLGEVFPFRGKAAEHYASIWNIKVISASCKILKLIRDPDSGWKYISQQEYILLTGSDPF